MTPGKPSVVSRRQTRPTTLDDVQLSELRKEIQDVTESILSLVKARQNLSAKVAKIKGLKDLPVEDLSAERNLLRKASSFARTISLEENLAESVARLLVEESKKVQRKEIYSGSVSAFLAREGVESISMIGCGRMGGWFAGYFRPLIKKLKLHDSVAKLAKRKSRELQCHYCASLSDAVESDLVFIAVPISKTPVLLEKIIREFSKYNGRTLRIIEISSVKEPLFRSELRPLLDLPDGKIDFISLHPLFGSSAHRYDSNVMIGVTSEPRTNSELSFAKSIFPHFKFVTMDWKSHDKLMALLLTIPHLLAFSFASIFAKNRKLISKQIWGPSFDSLVRLSQKVFSEDPGVYLEIQTQNPFSRPSSTEVTTSLSSLQSLTKDAKKFKRFFLTTRNFLNSLE